MKEIEHIQGYAGNQLRINLTNRAIKTEPVSSEMTKDYLGGVGYGVKLLYDELQPGIDPLGMDNKLILASGPLSLNQVPGGGSLSLCFKSPLTNAWGESRVGGNFAPDMKRAGYDYIILEGKADKPVYIQIKEDQIEIKDASHLLGRKVSEKHDILEKELGDDSYSILCIGPAGEKLVKFASAMSNSRAAGRCGTGAVMGSKNLLAIAVHGKKSLDAAHPQKFKDILRRSFTELKNNPASAGFKDFGTIGDIPGNDDGGDLPTKNWNSNSWGMGEKLFEDYEKRNFIKSYGCYTGCPMACGRKVHVPDGKFKTSEHGGAEYESIAAFTSFVLNQDMDAAVHTTYLCNEYGIDTISAGALIAFAMECFEQGLLKDFDLQNIDLSWGNADILPIMVRMISQREGIGDILAEGVKKAAQIIKGGSEEFAVHVKGLEGPAHDARSGKALAVAYGTASRGMCHIHPLEGMAWDRGKIDWGMKKFGLPDPEEVDRWDETGKGKAVKILQDGLIIPDIVGTCKFYMYADITLDHWAQMISALTGMDIDEQYLLVTGERVINLQRMFNYREGLTSIDDQLPSRVKKVPAFGKYSDEEKCGIKNFQSMLDEYYEERNWDKTSGKPHKEKLMELGIENS